jgi:hypothetical protein
VISYIVCRIAKERGSVRKNAPVLLSTANHNPNSRPEITSILVLPNMILADDSVSSRSVPHCLLQGFIECPVRFRWKGDCMKMESIRRARAQCSYSFAAAKDRAEPGQSNLPPDRQGCGLQAAGVGPPEICPQFLTPQIPVNRGSLSPAPSDAPRTRIRERCPVKNTPCVWMPSTTHHILRRMTRIPLWEREGTEAYRFKHLMSLITAKT